MIHHSHPVFISSPTKPEPGIITHQPLSCHSPFVYIFIHFLKPAAISSPVLFLVDDLSTENGVHRLRMLIILILCYSLSPDSTHFSVTVPNCVLLPVVRGTPRLSESTSCIYALDSKPLLWDFASSVSLLFFMFNLFHFFGLFPVAYN